SARKAPHRAVGIPCSAFPLGDKQLRRRLHVNISIWLLNNYLFPTGSHSRTSRSPAKGDHDGQYYPIRTFHSSWPTAKPSPPGRGGTCRSPMDAESRLFCSWTDEPP